jgi:hypothetical protein
MKEVSKNQPHGNTVQGWRLIGLQVFRYFPLHKVTLLIG